MTTSSLTWQRTRTSTTLGIAFLAQAVMSLIAGAFLWTSLITKDDVTTTLSTLAANVAKADTAIALQFITAILIVWLAVMLHHVISPRRPILATLGLALYVVEGTLLVLGNVVAFSLVRLAEHGGNSDVAGLLMDTKDIIGAVSMVAFGVGAAAFYFGLWRTRLVPCWLGLWGFVAVFLVLIVIPLNAYGAGIPFGIVAPYVPFEFVAGGYILARGLRQPASTQDSGFPLREAAAVL